MDISNKVVSHVSIDLVIAPFTSFDREASLLFQMHLEKKGIAISQANYDDSRLIVQRLDTNPITIEIGLIKALDNNPNHNAGIFSIKTTNPGRTLDLIIHEFEEIFNVFLEFWNSKENRVLLNSRVINQYLCTLETEHSFREIWKTWLKQDEKKLQDFGMPILGGGMRFVMPQTASDPLKEFKFETYFQETNKLFIEVIFSRTIPQNITGQINLGDMINKIDNYVAKEVTNFLKEN